MWKVECPFVLFSLTLKRSVSSSTQPNSTSLIPINVCVFSQSNLIIRIREIYIFRLVKTIRLLLFSHSTHKFCCFCFCYFSLAMAPNKLFSCRLSKFFSMNMYIWLRFFGWKSLLYQKFIVRSWVCRRVSGRNRMMWIAEIWKFIIFFNSISI
jgi:hypothetical protein